MGSCRESIRSEEEVKRIIFLAFWLRAKCFNNKTKTPSTKELKSIADNIKSELKRLAYEGEKANKKVEILKVSYKSIERILAFLKNHPRNFEIKTLNAITRFLDNKHISDFDSPAFVNRISSDANLKEYRLNSNLFSQDFFKMFKDCKVKCLDNSKEYYDFKPKAVSQVLTEKKEKKSSPSINQTSKCDIYFTTNDAGIINYVLKQFHAKEIHGLKIIEVIEDTTHSKYMLKDHLAFLYRLETSANYNLQALEKLVINDLQQIYPNKTLQWKRTEKPAKVILMERISATTIIINT